MQASASDLKSVFWRDVWAGAAVADVEWLRGPVSSSGSELTIH